MKARVLILAFTYPPCKDGVANAAALLAEGLAGRGHEVVVGTMTHPERSPSAPTNNPQVHQFHLQGSLRWGDPVCGQTNELQQLVRVFRGDAVFCVSLDTPLTLLARQVFAQVPAAKVLVSHGFPLHHRVPWHRKFPWGLGSWLRWQPFVWGVPRALKQFDRLVFLSRQQDWGRFLDHRVAHLLGHRGIRVIPNGVDWRSAPAGRPDFRRLYGLEDRLLLLCVGYYAEVKNQLLAVRAYRRARLPGSALVFIGSEFNAYSRLVQQEDESLARAFPEGRVVLLERQDRPTTEAAFAAMDAFVLPSRTEAQPIVLLESMAAGKPFVSTDTGCVRQLAGGLVVRGEAQMTQALQRLAPDPALRAQLGAAGQRDYLAQYRKEAVLDAYENLLRELQTDGLQR